MATTIQIKRGSEANIPTLSPGEFGYTTDTNKLYIGTSGGNKPVGGDEFLPLEGGTLTGDVNAGGNNVTNLGEPNDAGDAATKGYVDGKIAASSLLVTLQTTTSWTSQSTTAGTEYWEQSVTVPGLGASDQVDISLDADGLNQLLEDGVTALWAENTDGACVIKALGAAPTVALTLHLTLTEVSST